MASVDLSRMDSRAHEGTSRNAGGTPCSPAEKRGLLLVGLFKLTKATASVLLGVGSLRLVHRNVGDLVMRVLHFLRLDPEGRIVSFIMDRADLIDARDLRRFGVFAFVYAALCLIEGTGLMLRKTWAEYFTISLTVLGLPLEIFELVRRATWFKAGALVVNLLVLVYLVWILRTQRQRAAA